MKVKYHRKTLQSEDLGVGLACWVCGELLSARWPNATLLRVDGEEALDPAVLSLTVPSVTTLGLTTTGKMPDYFWVAYDPGSATIHEVVVLECKGTHTDGHVFTQLADAMHQVQAVTVGGATARAMAFGAMLDDRRIRVYGLDPEGSPLEGDVPERTEGRTTLEASVGDDETLHLTDPPKFRRRLMDVGGAQMLNWAGLADAAAGRLAGEPDASSFQDDEGLSVREAEAGDFVGVSSNLPVSRGVSYEVFFGLDRGVARALASQDEQSELEAFADARSRLGPARERLTRSLSTASQAPPSTDAPAEQVPEGFPNDPPGRARRPASRHAALDDPEDPDVVTAATPEGLFIEVRRREP
jgi:hypothetical protein